MLPQLMETTDIDFETLIEGELASASALEIALEDGISEADFEKAMAEAMLMWHDV